MNKRSRRAAELGSSPVVVIACLGLVLFTSRAIASQVLAVGQDLTNVTAIAAGGGDGIDYSIFLIGHTHPPPVLSISRSNEVLHLTLLGERFRRYVVEESAGANSPAAWAFKQNVVLPTTARATLQLPIAGNARFYRARLMP